MAVEAESGRDLTSDAGGTRVAIAGIRGIPANYGGSETAVEQIGRRLVADGSEVTVYCRRHCSPTSERSLLGMRRVVLPSARTFNADTISHSLLASLHTLLFDTADVVHFHGVGNGLVLPLFRFSKKRTVITIDGPDWERPKWGPLARAVLRAGARLATSRADAVIIDNQPSLRYFSEHFGVEGTYIVYGADLDPPPTTGFVESLGLQPGQYVLFVGALVPDKGPDVLLDAYREVSTDLPLVIVGDSPFHAPYRRDLERAAARDGRVRMLGYVWGDSYRELLAHAAVYAHPLRVDGTSPALLQAMGFGSCIVVNSIDEALAAVGDGALPYARDDPVDLARKLQLVLSDPQQASELRRRAKRRAAREYDWNQVAAAHGRLYSRLSASLPPSRGLLARLRPRLAR